MCFVHPFSEWRCGKCFECLQERRRDWSVRLQWDAENVSRPFIFHLTYNPEHLPLSPSGRPTLRKSDIDKFFKRLRHEFPKNKLSYFLCGEYSPELLRPHYHCALFNVPQEMPEYQVKEILQKAWSLKGKEFGFVLNSSCWCRSSAQIHYVTKYMLNGFDWKDYDDREKPFNFMSKSIGKSFIDYALKNNVFQHEIQDLFQCEFIRTTHIKHNKNNDGSISTDVIYKFSPVRFLSEEPFYYENGDFVVNPKLKNFPDFVQVYSVDSKGNPKVYQYPIPKYWRDKLISVSMRHALRLYHSYLARCKLEDYKSLYDDYDFDNDIPMWMQIKKVHFEKFAKSKKDKRNKSYYKYIK